MLNLARGAAVSGMLFLLAACGGGGGGGGGVNSTPTPPPVAQTNTSLTALQYSESFAGRAGIIQYNLSASGATPRGAATSSAAQVRYDAATQSYTLVGTPLAQSTFAATDRNAAQSTATITNYQKASGTQQETLALFNAGAGNTELALTYASYGGYLKTTNNGGNVDVDTAFFTYGVQTAAADMPRSGSATYKTQIDGQFADASGAYVLAGPSSFAADFAQSTFAFSMTPTGVQVLTGAGKSFGTQTVNGTIGSGTNQFNGQSGAGAYSTTLNGYFYGPQAAELGGVFTMAGGGGIGAGVVIGKKN